MCHSCSFEELDLTHSIAIDLQAVKPQEYICGSPCDSDCPYLFLNFGTYPELRKYCIHQSLGIALKMEKDTSCIK